MGDPFTHRLLGGTTSSVHTRLRVQKLADEAQKQKAPGIFPRGGFG